MHPGMRWERGDLTLLLRLILCDYASRGRRRSGTSAYKYVQQSKANENALLGKKEREKVLIKMNQSMEYIARRDIF